MAEEHHPSPSFFFLLIACPAIAAPPRTTVPPKMTFQSLMARNLKGYRISLHHSGFSFFPTFLQCRCTACRSTSSSSPRAGERRGPRRSLGSRSTPSRHHSQLRAAGQQQRTGCREWAKSCESRHYLQIQGRVNRAWARQENSPYSEIVGRW